MFKSFPSSFAILAAFFAALGTLFFVIGADTFYRNCQFAGKIERVNGVVTNRYTSVSHGRHGSTTHYHIQYQFRDGDEHQFVVSTAVASSTYHSLSANGPIPVKYLPHLPTISRIDLPAEDSSYETIAWGFLLAGGFFGGCGWYSFIKLERLIFYRRWLRKSGVRCVGKVDFIETNWKLKLNRRNPHYLLYSYTDSTGKKQQDKSSYLSVKQEGTWNEGNSIDVFYDPRDPSKSTVILDR